jgi:ribosomal-protein-alanine N-acetyltransferase
VSDRKSAVALSIEAMKAEDLPEVLSIADDPQGIAWTKGIFEKELVTHFSHNLICRAVLQTGEKAMAGFISFWVVAGEVHLHNVAVRVDLRRRGIGSRLMDEMFRTARAHGAARVTLELRESNQAAGALYRRFGFLETGRRPGYYQDRGEAAMILWADIEKESGVGNGPCR